MQNKKYIIYGAGNLGKIAYTFLKDFNLDLDCVVDIDPSVYKNDGFWKSETIEKIENVFEESKNNSTFLICISNYSFEDLKDKLISEGCKNVISFFELTDSVKSKNNYIPNGWKENKSKIISKKFQEVKNIFTDFSSKVSFCHFSLWRYYRQEVLRNEDGCKINTQNRYFIPEVLSVLKDDETFIDVGAYDGRASFEFMEKVNNKFKKIYMFEPDNYNFDLIFKNMFDVISDKIIVSSFALGNRKKKIRFAEGLGFLSKMLKCSKTKKLMISLDSLKLNPTIIKCHIEGMEYLFLKGTKKTIIKNRPIIMITTYHTEDGLYKIPLYLKKICKDYSFYWRNHNYMGQGAVMYCIPRERELK